MEQNEKHINPNKKYGMANCRAAYTINKLQINLEEKVKLL